MPKNISVIALVLVCVACGQTKKKSDVIPLAPGSSLAKSDNSVPNSGSPVANAAVETIPMPIPAPIAPPADLTVSLSNGAKITIHSLALSRNVIKPNDSVDLTFSLTNEGSPIDGLFALIDPKPSFEMQLFEKGIELVYAKKVPNGTINDKISFTVPAVEIPDSMKSLAAAIPSIPINTCISLYTDISKTVAITAKPICLNMELRLQ